MFKREMKINFKKFLIWTGILIGLFLVVFLIYPSIINDDSIKMMEEMVKTLPDGLLKSFNMDISSINSVYGWLKSEGFVFVLLIVGSFAGILGSNILLKEESDKTIEYLSSLPIKRKNIILNKVLVGVLYIILMVLIIGIFDYIGLSISGDFDKKQFVLLSITPLFPSLVIFFFCMFIGTFTHKTKKMTGISIGLVFISYILTTLSELNGGVSNLKYFSVFTLADIRNVITNVAINPVMIIISVILSMLFLTLTLVRYQRKDLV